MGNIFSFDIEKRAEICRLSRDNFQKHLSLIYITRKYLNILSKYICQNKNLSGDVSDIFPDQELMNYFRENYYKYPNTFDLLNKLKYSYNNLNSDDAKKQILSEVFENISTQILIMFDDFKSTCDFDKYTINDQQNTNTNTTNNNTTSES